MRTPPSPPSSSPTLTTHEPTNTRKRQRSQSMQSEASSSSPKRSVSQDPTSQEGLRCINSHDMPALSLSDSTQNRDIDAYMAEQGEESMPQRLTVPSVALTPAQKLAAIETLRNTPMSRGETWYVVSRQWYRRWQKACSGEVDKEGAVEEKDLGPVDNSQLADAQGNIIASTLEHVDVEFVPESAWTLFVSWYGEAKCPLPRKVIVRGILEELSLELHPKLVKLIRVANRNSHNESDMATDPPTPLTVSVSSADSLKAFCETLSARGWAKDGDRPPSRIWKLPESWDDSCAPDALKQAGATILEPSHRTVDEELIESDAFVVEYQVDGKFADGAGAPDIVTPSAQSPQVDVPPPLFGSGTDFFSRILPVASTSTPAKPTSTAVALKSVMKAGPSSNTRSRVSREAGTLGLGNMGNTCFMNSALQCLAHTRELIDYFLTGVFEDELNPENPLGMHGAIAEAFGALLTRIWEPSGSNTSYAPREFKQALQRFAPQFSGYQQHDSQELVAFLLDGLHEDLNRVLQKPYVEKPDWEGGGDWELVQLARASWEGYMKRNDSVIVDLFQGQYQSTLVCPECQKVSITFDPFMYLTLPLPIQKKWKHSVYYVPWDVSKPQLKVAVEMNRDASFKDLRQLLGRWMDADPDHLLTLEIFSTRFYKSLDDTCVWGDSADNDVIVCFELPCHSQQSRTYKPQPDDPFIVPVLMCDTILARQTYNRNPSLFGYPFITVIDRQQATSLDAIYNAVIDRLQRWTTHVRDLFTWEAGSPVPMNKVPLSGRPQADLITEIQENGDVVTVDVPEEGDIVDEKTVIVQDEDDMLVSEEPRKIGFKRDIFHLRVQVGTAAYGIGQGFFSAANHRFDSWEERKEESNVLLKPFDMLYCEFDENMKAYYFGDKTNYEHARWDIWDDYVHPEFTAGQKAGAAKAARGISLRDCLDEFTREEKLGEDDLWYCPRCKKHQQATKRFDLWKIPDVLVVHLKRFSNSRILRDKIDTFVDFPLEGLDLTDMVGERQVAKRLLAGGIDTDELGLGNLEEPLVYDLYAVDEHIGGLGGGHYRAYALNHVSDQWYHFDDSYVTPSQPHAAVNPNAYLLFYKRRTSHPLGGKTHAKIEAARNKPKLPSQPELPTPPNEQVKIPALLGPVSDPSQAPTTSSYRSQIPLSDSLIPSTRFTPSPDEPPSFDQSQYDEVLLPTQDTIDPLALSSHRYSFPGPSGKASPTSSNEVEPDDEARQELDSIDESSSFDMKGVMRDNGFGDDASSPDGSSVSDMMLPTEDSDEEYTDSRRLKNIPSHKLPVNFLNHDDL